MQKFGNLPQSCNCKITVTYFRLVDSNHDFLLLNFSKIDVKFECELPVC